LIQIIGVFNYAISKKRKWAALFAVHFLHYTLYFLIIFL
jgi:hypothetical protein